MQSHTHIYCTHRKPLSFRLKKACHACVMKKPPFVHPALYIQYMYDTICKSYYSSHAIFSINQSISKYSILFTFYQRSPRFWSFLRSTKISRCLKVVLEKKQVFKLDLYFRAWKEGIRRFDPEIPLGFQQIHWETEPYIWPRMMDYLDEGLRKCMESPSYFRDRKLPNKGG